MKTPEEKFGTITRALRGPFSVWKKGERVKVRVDGDRATIERVKWRGSMVTLANVMHDVPLEFVKIDETPALLKKPFTLEQLTERCSGKRDRECLYRLAKEVCIIAQDFESAMTLRALQNINKPTQSARLCANGQKTEKSPADTIKRKRCASGCVSMQTRRGVKSRPGPTQRKEP